MHTMDWTDRQTGKDWHIHHNGDYSGNVIISFPLVESPYVPHSPGLPPSFEREHEDVEIPFAMLKELVGQEVASNLISKIEDAGGEGLLDWLAT